MILIIGYGNSLRQDDGAGLILANIVGQALQSRGVAVSSIAVHQLMPELALDIARDKVDTVVFVDTRAVSPEDPDLAIQAVPLEVNEAAPSLGHHLDAAAVLAYAQMLYDKYPAAWQVTVPGVTFDHGEEFSAVTRKLLNTAHITLVDWISELGSAGSG